MPGHARRLAGRRTRPWPAIADARHLLQIEHRNIQGQLRQSDASPVHLEWPHKFRGFGKLRSSPAVLLYILLNELGRSPVMLRQQRHS